MDEIDIWRAAGLLIEQHGPRAGYDALARAGDLKAGGDEAGAEALLRIFEAVEELQRTERVAGEVGVGPVALGRQVQLRRGGSANASSICARGTGERYRCVSVTTMQDWPGANWLGHDARRELRSTAATATGPPGRPTAPAARPRRGAASRSPCARTPVARTGRGWCILHSSAVMSLPVSCAPAA